jgi:Sec-independent protein secretion pathway component TatC
MPQINPYEPPQTESLVEQADELSLAEHVERSFDMLFRLQIVFFVAFAICFLIMTEPMNWLGKLYRSALWGSTLTSF